jgi:MOSC domain-containing protein YiiM
VSGIITAVSQSPDHSFSKQNQDKIVLVAGLGVEGDAHLGNTVQHRSRVRKDPSQPNLRQVHLMHSEFHDELNASGFHVSAGDLGENITTRGVELLGLPTGTRLHLGDTAIVEVTGLRNPCEQLNGFQEGLMNACVYKDDHGNIVRKAGIMSIVLVGGEIRVGDPIRVELPSSLHRPLQVV